MSMTKPEPKRVDTEINDAIDATAAENKPLHDS